MDSIYGFIVCTESLQYIEYGYPADWCGTGSRFRWPFDTFGAENAKKFNIKLPVEKLSRWMIDGEYPELFDRQMLAHDIDYVRAYRDCCAIVDVPTRIYAFASSEEEFAKHSWYKNSDFLGYDCVSEDSFESYLFWDCPTTGELKACGLSLNNYGQFGTQKDAETYGRFRRLQLENGAKIEDMGQEKAVAVAIIREAYEYSKGT